MKFKKTLITCSNSGIAEAIIKKLKENSFDVTKATRNPIANEYKLDFFDNESIDNAVKMFCDSSKRFNSFVFIIPRIPASNNPLPSCTEWKEHLDHYFVKPMRFLTALINNKILNENAKVVMIGGITSKQAISNYAFNNVLRTMWISEFKTLALSFSTMSFNTVSLGGVLTDTYVDKIKVMATNNNVSFEEQLAQDVSNVPMRKYALPSDVADVVVPLCDSFANHLTGQNIVVDGGFIRAYN
ncbi:SDR family oxidoreductase [Photobacterium toruni]|uniref:SDR family oxidoreductase n=1 Tax=Photobacterium toruni TaxID=1935446 RepID=UPI002E192735|nr:SDR family oxidoreductase [Photobacterium toruni]